MLSWVESSCCEKHHGRLEKLRKHTEAMQKEWRKVPEFQCNSRGKLADEGSGWKKCLITIYPDVWSLSGDEQHHKVRKASI